MMRRRSFLIAAGTTLLLAGCTSQQQQRAPAGALAAAQLFAVADVSGQATVVGIGVRGVSRLFDLEFAASDLTWARCSEVPAGALVAIVRGSGEIEYWQVDRATARIRRLAGVSGAGDAVALGNRIWQLGPRNRLSVRDFSGARSTALTIPVAFPSRLAVSGARVFVLGQTTDGRPSVCEVSAAGGPAAHWSLGRTGQAVDLARGHGALFLSVVPDSSTTGADQSSELLVLSTAGAVLARRPFDNAGLVTSTARGVAAVDNRADGRHIIGVDPAGRELWDHRLASATDVVELRTLPRTDHMVAVQSDAVTLVTADGIRSLHPVGPVISQG